MTFRPSDTLQSRTYLGLILAQFLAAFNDQTIHIVAIFYASDMLVHYLGRVAGAVTSPFEWSVMRPKPGDGKALHAGFEVRFDPLNALAMCVWAEELRNNPVTRITDASAPTRARSARTHSGTTLVSKCDSASAMGW